MFPAWSNRAISYKYQTPTPSTIPPFPLYLDTVLPLYLDTFAAPLWYAALSVDTVYRLGQRLVLYVYFETTKRELNKRLPNYIRVSVWWKEASGTSRTPVFLFFRSFFFHGAGRVMPGVELRNPRNLRACLSTDLARGWFISLLWNDKARAK